MEIIYDAAQYIQREGEIGRENNFENVSNLALFVIYYTFCLFFLVPDSEDQIFPTASQFCYLAYIIFCYSCAEIYCSSSTFFRIQGEAPAWPQSKDRNT